jgi:hypothetical protein
VGTTSRTWPAIDQALRAYAIVVSMERDLQIWLIITFLALLIAMQFFIFMILVRLSDIL